VRIIHHEGIDGLLELRLGALGVHLPLVQEVHFSMGQEALLSTRVLEEIEQENIAFSFPVVVVLDLDISAV